jgi:hypothetical protein
MPEKDLFKAASQPVVLNTPTQRGIITPSGKLLTTDEKGRFRDPEGPQLVRPSDP